jgi:plasmid stabilization system protein ParE
VKYTVILNHSAEIQIRTTVKWIAEKNSPKSATRWHSRIRKALDSLVTDPQRCPFAYESTELRRPIRELTTGRKPHVYRILFAIDGESVEVIAVRHSSQNWISVDEI